MFNGETKNISTYNPNNICINNKIEQFLVLPKVQYWPGIYTLVGSD